MSSLTHTLTLSLSLSLSLSLPGDGANDVSMIQVADVGVGISGQEGMQVKGGGVWLKAVNKSKAHVSAQDLCT